MSKIDEVLKAASDTKALCIGNGVLYKVSDMFKEQFLNEKAIVIADDITFSIAGKQVSDFLKRNGVEQDNPYIFHNKDLYAEYTYVNELIGVLSQTKAIPIAVGSGTINDLTKLSSHLTGRSYMCIGTAASMDGYTSYGASITKDGAKQTFDCPAPRAWLGDTTIICQAPLAMTASGYADLFAKILAGADWIVSDELEVEPIDKKVWGIVQNSLPKALSNPQAIKEGNPEAIGDLIEGLILSGFAMQAHRSSRPASGADHQFSHLWNMEHHTNNGEHVSHGFQVSIGTLASLAMYEQALKTSMEELDIVSCCKAWPTADELAKEASAMFKGTDFPSIGVKQTALKYIPKDKLEDQLLLLKERWSHIKERLISQLIPFEEVKARLKLVGAPTEPEEIGVSREYLRHSYIRAQYIRNRFTILDLAVRTNMQEKWLNTLFGKGGRWEML